jgi:hypothetical protein
LIPSLVAHFGWEVHWWNEKLVFLHDDLIEEIYMEHTLGFEEAGNIMCRLKKSLYGLK